MRHAVYAGSFDPITNGHLWMIENGSRLFDRLTVAIGINPDKRYRFSLDDRLLMLRESVAPFANVTVTHFENLFLVNYARQIGATVILRGIRNEQDYGYERGMRYVNGEFDANILSAFLMPPREYAEISSSFVKGLVGPTGWEDVLRKYVPACVHAHFVRGTPAEVATPKMLSADVEAGLRARYAEPSLNYHNQAHIDACLAEFDAIRPAFRDPAAVELAIWFHDAIYDPRKTDNEERSADLADAMLSAAGVTRQTVETVRRLILATKHDAVPTDHDAQLLVDIDLSILGSADAAFDAYEQAIRQEYAHVPDETFRTGRAAVLRKFLARDRIYATECFASRFEAAARRNLQRSIEGLSLR